MAKEIFSSEDIFKDLTDFHTESRLEEFSHKNILTSLLENADSKNNLEKIILILSININSSLKNLNSIEDEMIDVFSKEIDIKKDKDNIDLLLKNLRNVKDNSSMEDIKEYLVLEVSLDEIIDKINKDDFYNEEVKDLYLKFYNNLSILIISFKLLTFYNGFNNVVS
ncbi:hypothetical protein UFVDC4_00182 [Staphylococcus phage vB_SauM-UFV_DC4]|nr:hypothetical protein UFVDC4_00182 [Staphylococcus phage vB_SauM-UFV_DC4]